MPDPPPSQRGRTRTEISDDIIEILQTTNRRAMTLGDITQHLDVSSATVNNRLKDLVEESTIESEKMGGATAYWIPSDDGPNLPRKNFRLIGANLLAGGFLGIAVLANLYPSVTGFATTDIIEGLLWVLMGAGLSLIILSYIYEGIPPTGAALSENSHLETDSSPAP